MAILEFLFRKPEDERDKFVARLEQQAALFGGGKFCGLIMVLIRLIMGATPDAQKAFITSLAVEAGRDDLDVEAFVNPQ